MSAEPRIFGGDRSAGHVAVHSRQRKPVTVEALAVYPGRSHRDRDRWVDEPIGHHPKNGTNYKKYDNAGKPFEHGAAWQSGRRFVKMVCGSTPSRRRWQQPFVARQAPHSLLKFFARPHFYLADTFA